MVDHLRDQYRASERHPCRVLFDGARHVSLPEPSGTVDGVADADTRDRTEQGALRYRKIRVLLNREAGRLESIWCIGCTRKRAGLEEKPQRKSKAVRHREERFIATAPKQAWSIDSWPISCTMARTSGR
jgi:putative transposase